MQKITPTQLEAFKQKLLKLSSEQAKNMASQYNLKLNEKLLPDYQIQPPSKDLTSLALIPKQPPTLIQLADGLCQAKKIEAVAPNVRFTLGISSGFNGHVKGKEIFAPYKIGTGK